MEGGDKVEGMNKILHKYFLLQEQAYRDSPISNTIGKKYIIYILKPLFIFFSFPVEISTPLNLAYILVPILIIIFVIIIVIIIVIVVCIVW